MNVLAYVAATIPILVSLGVLGFALLNRDVFRNQK